MPEAPDVTLIQETLLAAVQPQPPPSVTFTLPENVKFHNGKTVTSADAKYTLDALFQAGGYKSGSFYDTAPDAPGGRESHITGIETPKLTYTRWSGSR